MKIQRKLDNYQEQLNLINKIQKLELYDKEKMTYDRQICVKDK